MDLSDQVGALDASMCHIIQRVSTILECMVAILPFPSHAVRTWGMGMVG